MAVLSLLSTFRELVLPEAVQQKLNLHNLLTLSWPWYVWAIVALLLLLAVVFDGAFSAVQRRERDINSLLGRVASLESKRPCIEPDALFMIASRTGQISVVNTGDDTAIDIAIGPLAGGVVSFGVIRVLRPLDPKTEVPILWDPHGANADVISALSMALVYSKMSNTTGKTIRSFRLQLSEGNTVLVTVPEHAQYVPLCITYNDTRGRQYHTHDYVFFDASIGSAPIDHCIVIRPKTDNEAVYAAALASAAEGRS
jgi:hypothetical protein